MIDFVHLHDSDGQWVAWYRRGMPYVWNTRDVWVGWFAWEDGELAGDVLDLSGEYLGTVVGDRLWCRTYRSPVAAPRRVAEPQRPTGPPDVSGAVSRPPPSGFADVAPARLRGGGHPDFSG